MAWLHRLDLPGVTGGFIGRCVADERDAVLAEALATMGADRRMAQAEQVHGGEVAIVRDEMLDPDAPIIVPGVDALVTEVPDAALAIYVADCLAVYLINADATAVGLAHAGWRGLAADIPGALAATLLKVAGGSPGDLRATLSPCIRGCCFEVGEEVAQQFDDLPGAVDRSRARPHVDMIAATTAQLRAAGLPEACIEVMDGCTRCEPDRFASYRWDPDRCGRNIALVGIDQA